MRFSFRPLLPGKSQRSTAWASYPWRKLSLTISFLSFNRQVICHCPSVSSTLFGPAVSTPEHKDPFDRMIAAQSIHEDLALISNDEQLDIFGVRREW